MARDADADNVIVDKIAKELHDHITRQDGVVSVKTVVTFDDGEPYISETRRIDGKLEEGGPDVG